MVVPADCTGAGHPPRHGLPACATCQNGSRAKPATPPAGSEASKQATPPTGSSSQPSQCEPFREIILAKLEVGLSAQRIWQDLRADHGFAHGYDSVKRFVRRLGQTRPLPFRRMECEPGEQAQIDFGTGAPVIRPDGKRSRTHTFRVVLTELYVQPKESSRGRRKIGAWVS